MTANADTIIPTGAVPAHEKRLMANTMPIIPKRHPHPLPSLALWAPSLSV